MLGRSVDNPAAYMRAAVVNGCNDSLRRLRRHRKREPDLVGPSATIDAPVCRSAMCAAPTRSTGFSSALVSRMRTRLPPMLARAIMRTV